MTISWLAWEQAQRNLVQDFLDLFLPPSYSFAVDKDYPKTASMEGLIKGRFNTLELPETKLLRLGELFEESWPEDFPRKGADLVTVYAYDVLEGFGQHPTSNLQGAAFEGLKQLATTWGSYLAREVERLFRNWQLFTAFTDFIFDLVSIFLQIPPKELGGIIRESVTPAYLRAGEAVAYTLALFHNDRAKMKESMSILEASDTELERYITNMFRGYSTEHIGRRMQCMLVEVVSQGRELFSSNKFRERFSEMLPKATLIAYKNISWYIGYCLGRNLQYDPQRTKRLLEAIGRHKEIEAAMEQYRYKYCWQGDRNKAVNLAWQAVAPKYFGLPPRVEAIEEDEAQERLIGLAEGLAEYTEKNRAIKALSDGHSGRLGAYLGTAAENQEIDHMRKQRIDGNIILTEAQHAEDFRHPDREEEEELSDDELLSREREKHHPSRDLVADEVETQENYRIWYGALTEQEKTAVDLTQIHKNEEEVAKQMGISQQRVSQLLQQAFKKWRKAHR